MYLIYGWDELDFRCNPCLKAKRLAELKSSEWGFEYKFVPLAKHNVTDEHQKNRLCLETTLDHMGVELKTLPQIFATFGGDTVLIGGFDEFKKHINHIDEQTWNNKSRI